MNRNNKKKPGIVSFLDDIEDFNSEYQPYCSKINETIMELAIKEGKIRVVDNSVTYFYRDRNIECHFVVGIWENIDRYVLLINPRRWNRLPKGYDSLCFKCRGWNIVYDYENCGGTPILFTHVPGKWSKFFPKKYTKNKR